jgi:hypothetical protein
MNWKGQSHIMAMSLKKKQLFWGVGRGRGEELHGTFLILSVVSYWFEIAVRRRRECLAKTLVFLCN